MSTALFEHNQTAYDSAARLLASAGKAAVIHPTGTGKSFIGFRLCEDHPGDTVCWLSPSAYIFKTQTENWAQAGGAPLSNITFYTYAKLSLMSEDELTAIRPDRIVLDEYHRAGAPTWEKNVRLLMRLFPSVPVLGLSATNVRYLDDRRDMAEELFDGHIASRMTLGEAIVRGILTPPKYVMALYSYQKELERFERRVAKVKSRPVRDKAEQYLQALRRTLEMADGLDVIFEKHMTDPHGKYIVFCADYTAMRECRAAAREMFRRVDAAPHTYAVYSADPEASRSFRAFKTDNDTAHLRLLYAIDALNEGIHVENVDGVILFRPTVSPTVYKQQVGRCLSAAKGKDPVIFDIVNNFDNLYSVGALEEEMQAAITYYRYLGENEVIVNERFRIFDELRDAGQLFEALEETLSASWEIMYAHAAAYYQTYQSLNVPLDYRTADGYYLGQWVNRQRAARCGKYEKSARLTPEQIGLLDRIGMQWDSLTDLSWERHIAACRQYVREHGDLLVPGNYVTPDRIPLGRWIMSMRTYKKNGIRNNFFTAEREKQLDALGMVWDQPNYLWERNYAAALQYYKEHGDLNIPKTYIQDGIKLGLWLQELKLTYRGKRTARTLTQGQIDRLNELHIQWFSPQEQTWQDGCDAAKQYCREHGAFDVPVGYVTASGYKLGGFLRMCRQKYAKGKLTDAEITQLEQLGICWNKRNAKQCVIGQTA